QVTEVPQATLDRARAVLDHYFAQLEEETAPAPARRTPPTIVHKDAQIQQSDGRRFKFVASTTTVDHYGDIIEQNWDLKDFCRNPQVLWGHRHNEFPVGKVLTFETNPEKTVSIAEAELLPEGEDETADKLARFLQAGHLKAVSVGFMPTSQVERRSKKGGFL